MKVLRYLLVPVLVTVWSVSVVGVAHGGALLKDLENALMCQCDDRCGKVMINCTCDTSHETRRDFAMKLESGLTVEQIIQAYVDKYGETVLSAPTKTGFNLTAWVTPFAALVVGGFGVRKVMRSWTRKDDDDDDDPPPGNPSGYSSRLQNELDKLET